MQPDYGAARTIARIDSATTLLLVPVPREMWTDYILAVRHEGNITASRRIKGAWIDSSEQGFRADFRFLDPPIFSLGDVDGDTRPELLIRDRQHIGTWNAACLHVYDVARTALEYVGSFEYLLHLPVEDRFIRREWDFALNRVTVSVTRSPTSKEGRIVGHFEIDPADGLRFESVKVIDELYGSFVLPAAGTVSQKDGW